MIPIPSTAAIKLGVVVLASAGFIASGWTLGKRSARAEIAELGRVHAEQVAAAHAARAAEVDSALERARKANDIAQEIANVARDEQKRLAAARAAADAESVRLRHARAAYLAAWAACPPSATAAPGGDAAAGSPTGVPDVRRIAELSDRLDRVGRGAAAGADACDASFRAFEQWVERALIPACGGARD